MGMPATRPEVPRIPSPERKPPLPIDDQTRRGTADEAVASFSIVVGGPAYDFLLRLGLLRFSLPNILRRMTILAGLAWLPLLLLAVQRWTSLGPPSKSSTSLRLRNFRTPPAVFATSPLGGDGN
jgi:hypothetical protein